MMSEHKTARPYRDPYLLAELGPLLRTANAEAANTVLPRDIARLLQHLRELETGYRRRGAQSTGDSKLPHRRFRARARWSELTTAAEPISNHKTRRPALLLKA